MYTSKGTNRIVVCFPTIGIVFKFPIKNPIIGLVNQFRFLKRIRSHNKMREEMGIKRLNTVKACLRYLWLDSKADFYWSGFRANLFEVWIYWTTLSPFLEPTYFSFFGLCNIQRHGVPLKMDDQDHLEQFYGVVGRDFYANGHHFENPNNFSFDGVRIRMLDYGSHGIRDVVVKHGRVLVTVLDPGFVAPDL